MSADPGPPNPHRRAASRRSMARRASDSGVSGIRRVAKPNGEPEAIFRVDTPSFHLPNHENRHTFAISERFTLKRFLQFRLVLVHNFCRYPLVDPAVRSYFATLNAPSDRGRVADCRGRWGTCRSVLRTPIGRGKKPHLKMAALDNRIHIWINLLTK
jgi:hypothetical protein